MQNKYKLGASVAIAVLGWATAGTAFAQSTAGQVEGVIITGSRAAPSTAGLAVQVNEAKDEAIVTQQFIQTRTPSANLAQFINLVPGVSYSTEDPGGLNSGDLRIHGFDGAHVAVILDGAPLNDTGNYAVYPGEYLIGELIDHMTVNIGSSDVDSPSASALGATINIVSKTPPKDMGGQLKFSGGSYHYTRGYGEFDTGTLPTGATAFVAGEWANENNFKGRPGASNRWDLSGRIYQPLKGDDFISLSGIYTQERQYPAFRASPATLASAGKYFLGDNYTWTPPTIRPGIADTVPSSAGPAGADTNFYKMFPNPVNFGSLRGQSRFALTPNLTFTFDPSFLYSLANGGGSLSLSEKDKRLIGNSSSAGIDLNGDGDTLDTVAAYSPQNTRTYRVGLTSSLLYDIDTHNHLQLSYTLDWGHHRQTGEVTTVDQSSGIPSNVFGALPGYGPPITDADGSLLRNRDRLSIAMLNQVSANYIGKFVDDRLHVNIGVRAPFFKRELNQYCYSYNGTSAYCDTVNPAAEQSAYATDLAAHRAPGASAAALTTLLGTNISTGAGGLPNIRAPFNADVDYNRVLPNAGISYRIAEKHLIYASYARGFTAPKTDDLYSSTNAVVQPETSDNFSIGYRYQTRMLNFSASLYDTEYQNRIVQSYDPNDPTLSIDRNVGDVTVRGIDLEAGLNPTDQLHLYASANFNDSKLKSNYVLTTSGVTFALPTKGKELVLTPDQMISGRISYDIGPVTVGFEGKYVGKRYISDTNDVSIPSYTTFDLDARWNMPYLAHHSYLQLNVDNLFDKYYISRANTISNGANYPIPGSNLIYTPSALSYWVGAPLTAYLTLGITF